MTTPRQFGNIAPMAPPLKPQPPKVEPAKAAEPAAAYWPNKCEQRDFFRVRREGNGSIVEMVRLTPDRKGVEWVRDVWAWDMLPSTERRLLTLAFEAERER